MWHYAEICPQSMMKNKNLHGNQINQFKEDDTGRDVTCMRKRDEEEKNKGLW